MSKIERKKEDVSAQEVALSFDEVKLLSKEYLEVGEVEFLVSRKCIRIYEQGRWIVKQYEGLKGSDAAFGYQYTNDIPYSFWAEVVRQINFYIRRKEEKENQENKSLEALAQEF